MKNSSIVRLLIAVSVGCLILCSGGSNVAGGGGTRGGNPVLAGTVLDSAGTPVPGADVGIAAKDYDPLDPEVSGRYIQTRSDSEGRFVVTVPSEKAFSVTAWDSGRIHSGFVTASVDGGTDTTVVPDLEMSASGTLVVRLPIGVAEGAAALTGTSIVSDVAPNDNVLVFNGVPRNLTAGIRFRADGASRSRVLVENIVKSPAARDTVIVDALNSFSKRIVLNTTAEGADVAQSVYDIPILVRLDSTHSGILDNESAEQIRIYRNKDALPVRVESWDRSAQSAALWVLVDTVRGHATTELIMYWGEVPSEQMPEVEVFDTAHGFTGVYSLDDMSPDRQVADATPGARHGVADDQSNASVPAQGIIGGAQRFSRQTKRLTLPTPAIPDGIWTMSAWFRPEGPINQGCIVGDSTGGVRLSYGSSSEPSLQRNAKVHLVYSEGEPGFKNLGDGPLDDSWHYIAATCDTSKQRCSLYIDGKTIGDIHWTTGTVSVPSYGACIGGGYVEPFVGRIDEVRISRTVRSPGWLKLCYENQRRDGRFVEFK